MKAMDLNHTEWTDKLSDYLDGELPDEERYAVESHLAGCADCAAVLADLRQVVARAQDAGNAARPPEADLWAGIAARIDNRRAPAGVVHPVKPFGAARESRRISFTLPQLAAAAVVLMAISAGVAWQTAQREVGPAAESPVSAADRPASVSTEPSASDDVQPATISFADPQYDAAVTDLEKAVRQGRGRLDQNTIAIVEHNLQIIDQAIEQARQALDADPANSYLTSHLFEARRRKLDLLRRAAALSESN